MLSKICKFMDSARITKCKPFTAKSGDQMYCIQVGYTAMYIDSPTLQALYHTLSEFVDLPDSSIPETK